MALWARCPEKKSRRKRALGTLRFCLQQEADEDLTPEDQPPQMSDLATVFAPQASGTSLLGSYTPNASPSQKCRGHHCLLSARPAAWLPFLCDRRTDRQPGP